MLSSGGAHMCRPYQSQEKSKSVYHYVAIRPPHGYGNHQWFDFIYLLQKKLLQYVSYCILTLSCVLFGLEDFDHKLLQN